MKKIIRVNTRTHEIQTETASGEMNRLGGRSFIAHIALKEIDPNCESLGRKNKFILSTGLLGDTSLTTAGRHSIGGKSPLTGGIKEANVGGNSGKKMAAFGIKAIILEDAPEQIKTHIVLISSDKTEILSVPQIRNLSVSDTISFLRDRFGKDAGVTCIGPAGEMMMGSALVATSNRSGSQIRVAGRGGMGAVMGSKGIKAIVFDDTGASPETPHDPIAFKSAAREVARIIKDDPKTENRHNFGTPAVLGLCDSLGILPTRNFSTGHFEQVEAISGETIAKLIDERGGEGGRGKPCVQGCTIQCSNIFPDPAGKAIVASIQYENIALLGSNCGIGDIDAIAEMNRLCNEIGIDAIETGAAIGVAMEAGIIPFGDVEGAKDILDQVWHATPLGRVIGNGSVITGKVFGVRRVPAVKGQAIPAYDPRSLKGIGVTYITSSMGADHTAGNALELASVMDPIGTEGQVEASRRLQMRGAILDSLGICLFIRPAFVKKPELFAKLLNARYGWDLNYSDVQQMGVDCLEAEEAFNERAGIKSAQCDVPEFMQDEPLPPHNTVFDIPKEKMNTIWSMKPKKNEF